jgi:hypothetical protein
MAPVVVSIANSHVYARHVDVDTLRLNRETRSNRHRADKVQHNSYFQ